MLVAAYRRYIRFLKLSALFETSSYSAGISQCLFCKTSAGRRNAEYEIDSTGSVVRDATRTGSGGIIGAFRLRSQRRDGSELAKSAGCLCVYRMRKVHRGLSGEHHREKTISP